MTAPAPANVRVIHADGTATPLAVEFVEQQPREVNGDIFIVDVYEATGVVAWKPGDRLDADDMPDSCAIRMHRLGSK